MLLKTPHSLLTNLYRHRRYIWHNAWNELRYRYAGTGMGIFWNVVHPLVEILIYTVVFSLVFPKRTRGISYRLYITTGILTWRCFSEMIQRGGNAFIENTRYLKRLSIPSEIFVAKIALTSTLMLTIYYLVFLPINVVVGNPVSWKWLLLPCFLFFLQCLAFGMTLSLANLRVLFPDIKEIISAFMPLWRWTLPLIYPETILPEFVRRWLFLNPPHIFIRSIRRLVLEQELPGILDWVIMSLWLLLLLGVGTTVNQKLRAEVKDAL